LNRRQMSFHIGDTLCFRHVAQPSRIFDIWREPVDGLHYEVVEITDSFYRLKISGEPDEPIDWVLTEDHGTFYYKCETVLGEVEVIKIVPNYREFYPEHDTDDFNLYM